MKKRTTTCLLGTILIAGCATTNTGEMGGMIGDAAKDGDIVGAGLMTLAMPFAVMMDVFTLGNTLDADDLEAVNQTLVAASNQMDAVGAGGNAALQASEICPLSEPYKSQCNARNAARRGRPATPRAGGAAQGLPAEAQRRSSTPPSSPLSQQQQQQGGSAASRASGFVYDPQNHTGCVQFQAIQDNRPDSGLAYGSYIERNVCPYRVKFVACVTALDRDGSNMAQFNQHTDGNKCPGAGFGASELGAGESKTSRTWFQYSQIRFNSMVCKPEWSIVSTDDRNTSIQYIGQRYRCRKLQ